MSDLRRECCYVSVIHRPVRPNRSPAVVRSSSLARGNNISLSTMLANINIYLFVIIIKWCCSSLATTLIVVLIFRSLRHRAVRWRDHLAAGLAFRACIMMVCRLPSYDVCAEKKNYHNCHPAWTWGFGPCIVLGYVGLVSYLGNLGMDLCINGFSW